MGSDESGGLIYGLLKVRPGEVTRTALHFLYLLNAVGAFIIGRNVAAALFLSEYHADRLAWMYVASAAAVSAAAWIYGRIIGRVRLDRLIAVTLMGLLVAIALARMAMAAHLPFVYPAFYVLVEVMGSLLVIQFWSFANAIHDTRQAKRLFGVIGAGGVLANVVVGFGAAALVGIIGTENLLYVMMGNLAICVVVVGVLGRGARGELARERLDRPAPKRRRISLSHDGARVLGSRHLRIIAAMVVLTFIVTTLVDYQFKILAQEAFDKTELTAFFSLLYGVTGIVSLGIQLFVTSRLLERFGILAALVLLPLSLTFGSVGILLFPVALAAACAKGADAVFRYTVNDATTQLLYLPVPVQLRSRAKAFIDGILKPAAYGTTGLAIAGLVAAFPGLDRHVEVLAIPAIVLGLVWLGLVFGIRGAYVRSLLDTLRRRRLGLGEARMRLADGATVEALRCALEGDDADQVASALEILEHLEGGDLDEVVLRLLGHDAPRIRVLALAHLERRGRAAHASKVSRLLGDVAPEVRAAAVSCTCALGREKAIRAVRGFLDDPIPEVQAATMEGLIKYGGLDGVLAAASALKDLLESPDPELRVHGARVLGAIGVRNFYHPILRLLGDADPRVVLAAIESAGRMGSPELLPPLVYKLADPRMAPAAVTALSSYGGDIERTLGKVLDNPDEDAPVREGVPRVLGRLATPGALSILLAHLAAPDEGVRTAVCRALSRIHHARPDLAIDRRALEAAATREVRWGFEVVRALADLELAFDRGGGVLDSAGLLASALEDKRARAVDRVLRLVAVLHPPGTLDLVRHSLGAADPTVRANALEVLDTTLGARLGRLVLPLVDDRPRKASLAVATERFGLTPQDPEATLLALLSDPDPWVAACALHHLGATRDDAGPQALPHLRSRSEVVRETAAAVVAATLEAEAVRRHLGTLADDPSPTVRTLVADRLAALGPRALADEAS